MTIQSRDNYGGTVTHVSIAANIQEAVLAERERCLDILMRVGISAMEAGHTNVGKYIAAASTQIRGPK